MITIVESRCTGCGVCLGLCPQEAIVMEAGRVEIRQELCVGCGVCVSACPERAIQDVDLAPVVQLSPGRLVREPALPVLPPGEVERASTRHRPVKIARESASVFESRPAVAAAAMAMGPFAIDLLARLVDRWFVRSSLPDRMRCGRYVVTRRSGGCRRWRGGRCR